MVEYLAGIVQLVRTLPCQGRGRRFESDCPRILFMKYLALFICIFLPLISYSKVTIKATGYVVVRIVSNEQLINSDTLVENKQIGNEIVYSYVQNNTINYVF